MSRAKPAIKDRETKSQILGAVAEATELSKKQVQAVLTALREHAIRHLNARGSGEMSVPELGVKLRRVKKAARKAGMARNPFTGEMVKVEARPASLSVRAAALKALKDAVAS
jgi:nucleoid DNA-binding protein